MVLVTVGEEYTSDFIGILFKIRNIGDHKVDTEHIFIGERKTAVNYYDIVAVLKNGEVLADLVKTAKHHYFQFLFLFLLCHNGLLFLVVVWCYAIV